MLRIFGLTSLMFIGLASAPAEAVQTTNYDYGLFISRPLPSDIRTDQTIEQIAAQKGMNDEIKGAILNSARETQSGFMRMLLADPKALDPRLSGMNLQSEMLKTVRQFNKSLASELKKLKITQPLRYQIHFAPFLSPILVARRRGETVTPSRFAYPIDRINLVEYKSDLEDTTPDVNQQILSEIFPGIASRLVDGYMSQPENPFFVSLSITLDIEPVVEQSHLTAQVVLGTPVNTKRPFAQGNSEIVFSTIEFPTFNTRALGIGSSDLPAAIVTFEQKLRQKDQGQLLIEFGPVNGFQDGRWVRQGNGGNYRDLAPKLIGTPQGAAGLGGALEVSFNVLNVTADLETKGVADLDLYISAGLAGLPGMRAGWINNSEIDGKFRTEINKSIQAAIADQKKRFKEKGINGIDTAKAAAPAVLQQLMSNLFTLKPEAAR